MILKIPKQYSVHQADNLERQETLRRIIKKSKNEETFTNGNHSGHLHDNAEN